jgi:hypothetical protein
MGVRIHDLEELIMRLLDAGVRSSLCPHSQTVQREAYRPIEDHHLVEQARGKIGPLESITIDDIFRLFARRGVHPNYWYYFVHAFIWCMKTHVPYAQDDDHEEFEKLDNNPFARAITQTVVLPAIECFTKLMGFLRTDLFTSSPLAPPGFGIASVKKSERDLQKSITKRYSKRIPICWIIFQALTWMLCPFI